MLRDSYRVSVGKKEVLLKLPTTSVSPVVCVITGIEVFDTWQSANLY